MPDRAVVESRPVCLECGRAYVSDKPRTFFVVRDGGDEYPGVPLCPECVDAYENDDDVQSIEEEEPSPRALVALSEDRQWLAVHTSGRAVGFDIFERWENYDTFGYSPCNWVPDIGQDAHEVLVAWLEGQQG